MIINIKNDESKIGHQDFFENSEQKHKIEGMKKAEKVKLKNTSVLVSSVLLTVIVMVSLQLVNNREITFFP